MTKDEIAQRREELQREAEQAATRAADDAYRHTRAAQGAERLALMAECGKTGHFYDGMNLCSICLHDKNMAQKTLSTNLTKSTPTTYVWDDSIGH